MEGVSKYRRCEVALIIHWIIKVAARTAENNIYWDKCSKLDLKKLVLGQTSTGASPCKLEACTNNQLVTPSIVKLNSDDIAYPLTITIR